MEAAPPPLANARRQAKYSLRFLICAPPENFQLRRRVFCLALNEQVAGLLSFSIRLSAAEGGGIPPRPRLDGRNFSAAIGKFYQALDLFLATCYICIIVILF